MIDHPSIPQDWPSVAGLLLIAIFIRYLIIRSRRLDLPFLNRSEFQSDRTLLVEADLKVYLTGALSFPVYQLCRFFLISPQ